MPVLNALATVAVKNLAAAVVWYEKVFGRPPDSRPMPEVAPWKFERGGWLQYINFLSGLVLARSRWR
jgi:hypothetical protein